ncbi:MAG: hypothetical protein PHF86_01420 [Candidatus Nanoarchaeia archaeon]|nr:hypothetical protein [Candidatus Nanoarchaeia archaeon]
MAKVILKWELKSVNFDKLKSELPKEIQERIGSAHCKLCVLASGLMCIYRKACRANKNEIFINSKIEKMKNERKSSK